MGDYSELKTLLDACLAKNCDGPREFQKACEALFDVCSIETIAGLVAENERYRKYGCDTCDGSGHLHRADGEYFGECTSCGAYELEQAKRERDQLKAENDRLRKLPTCWSEVLEQSEANDELLDKVLELGADAERYRWLRSQHWNESDMVVACHPKKSVKLGFDCPSGERLDHAIDAAMGKGEQA